MTYKIQLPNFEGPLDLLLFFIKRDELNIYDIPISKITKEFLDYVRIIQLLDLELAGEFIVMASSLMQIKVRMLLPREEQGENAEEDDPRKELVERLLEYKKYKEMAGEFAVLEAEQRYAYYRQFFKADVRAEQEEDFLGNVTLFHLLTAFKKALAKAPRESLAHTIEQAPVTLEEQASYVLETLRAKRQITFAELTVMLNKSALIVTFLALLELLRSRSIGIQQEAIFGEILVYRT